MSERQCGRCGRPLPTESPVCTYCQSGILRWRREATIVLSLVAVGVVLFTATWFLTQTFERHRQSLAVQWFDAGQQALANSQPRAAIADLRSALFYRDDDLYRLRLAEALAQANYTDQAKAYLLNLWEERPGSGNINLELARITAQQSNTADAVRYYHGAIFGVWDKDAIEHRLETRLELIRFLLRQGQTSSAYAEITSLAASIPPDNPQMQAVAGDLFARTGDSANALTQYEMALKNDPHSFAALSGAARAAFASGKFRRAKQHLDAALREHPDDSALTTLLEQTDLVLASDPLERHLPREQRVRRTLIAFNQVGVRLQQCGVPVSLSPSLAAKKISNSPDVNSMAGTANAKKAAQDLTLLANDWNNLRPSLNVRSLSLNSDLFENAVDLVSRIEQATDKSCGPPTGLDWALLQLANYGSEVER
jgi:tetratricopeptide (TPR) repeat protein